MKRNWLIIAAAMLSACGPRAADDRPAITGAATPPGASAPAPNPPRAPQPAPPPVSKPSLSAPAAPATTSAVAKGLKPGTLRTASATVTTATQKFMKNEIVNFQQACCDEWGLDPKILRFVIVTVELLSPENVEADGAVFKILDAAGKPVPSAVETFESMLKPQSKEEVIWNSAMTPIYSLKANQPQKLRKLFVVPVKDFDKAFLEIGSDRVALSNLSKKPYSRPASS
jgi:hypothetical protein